MANALRVRLRVGSPRTRKALWRVWYTVLAGWQRQSDWTFMNYGYAPDPSNEAALPLDERDEADRYCIQLYHHVAGAVDLVDKTVLEVGCGRGGGASYIARALGPKTVLGVDYSPSAVRLCRRVHADPSLSFEVGDAEALPCENESFDVVVNVESSHCYESLAAFFGEVYRILRPGGHFLWADLGSPRRMLQVRQRLADTGFETRRETEITSNVLAALEAMSEQRSEMIRRLMPRVLVRPVSNFAGVRGSRVYESLRSGATEYRSAVLQKPQAGGASGGLPAQLRGADD
jgi:ubiquinone/menaquinone biosynthesis C-methylase UbiE